MLDRERLIQKAAKYGVVLDEKTAGAFDIYACLLAKWNRKFNLTAITQPEDMEDKHFVDCLILANQPEVAGTIADIGSGAGFPGMVIKQYKQELQVTLMEPTGKRVTFLQALAEELNLPVTILKERAEEAARKKWRENFDVVTARAVASLPALCEYCLPLVAVGGWFIAMKGEARDEIEKAKQAIKILGGQFAEARGYTLPDGSARTLVMIQKVTSTRQTYPRNGGKIKKAPLVQGR